MQVSFVQQINIVNFWSRTIYRVYVHSLDFPWADSDLNKKYIMLGAQKIYPYQYENNYGQVVHIVP